jgi:hypothetical protein
MRTIFETVGGRKFIIAVLALVAVTVLALEKSITGDQALQSLVWIVGLSVGAIAAEDIGTKLAAKK